MTSLAITSLFLLLQPVAGPDGFELASTDALAIVVPESEPECVRLAASDLANDLLAVLGRRPATVGSLEEASGPSVLITTLTRPASAALLGGIAPQVSNALRGKWEAYRVQLTHLTGKAHRPVLLIAGGDERGTMFGIYAFCEQYLGVDPMYFWADRPPKRRQRLSWERIEIGSDGPSFHYRGWFINDEDLLTEWFLDGGDRDIDYPYYERVTSPQAARRVFEAMLRLRMNLVIPASFVDIRNPDERRLIDEATRRGLLVSQHHIEPLGVSGFGYQNYWRDRGEKVPYSFIRHPERFEQIWRDYAQRWAKYGDRVVWQLGLRGIADQPIWAADPAAPKTAAERGKMISEAMALQRRIVQSVDRRANPPMTTTLWMEGAGLHQEGHLQFPADVTVIFSDNSPGWQMQRDFYEVKRQPEHHYGVYYHQAVWGWGPHLVQGLSPQKMHSIFRQAVERGSDYYLIMNVSNVREFCLGVDAASRMLWDFAAFDPDRYLTDWCRQRFGPAAAAAERCYRQLFASFVKDTQQGTRRLMDGEILHLGERVNKQLSSRLKTAAKPLVKKPANLRKRLALVEDQRAAAEAAGAQIDIVLAQLAGADKQFFESNFVAQQRILTGLLGWTASTLQAALAMSEDDRSAAVKHLRAALASAERVRQGQKLATRGKWEHWYRGDRKMNLPRAFQGTRELLAVLSP